MNLEVLMTFNFKSAGVGVSPHIGLYLKWR